MTDDEFNRKLMRDCKITEPFRTGLPGTLDVNPSGEITEDELKKIREYYENRYGHNRLVTEQAIMQVTAARLKVAGEKMYRPREGPDERLWGPNYNPMDYTSTTLGDNVYLRIEKAPTSQ